MSKYNNFSFRSELSKVKKLGAAGNGTVTWIKQRVSAVIMIPLTIWFVFLILCIAKSNTAELYSILSSPCTIILFLMFAFTGLYHGTIGMREILEDYISCKYTKNFMLIMLYFAVFLTVVSTTCSVLLFHFSSY